MAETDSEGEILATFRSAEEFREYLDSKVAEGTMDEGARDASLAWFTEEEDYVTSDPDVHDPYRLANEAAQKDRRTGAIIALAGVLGTALVVSIIAPQVASGTSPEPHVAKPAPSTPSAHPSPSPSPSHKKLKGTAGLTDQVLKSVADTIFCMSEDPDATYRVGINVFENEGGDGGIEYTTGEVMADLHADRGDQIFKRDPLLGLVSWYTVTREDAARLTGQEGRLWRADRIIHTNDDGKVVKGSYDTFHGGLIGSADAAPSATGSDVYQWAEDARRVLNKQAQDFAAPQCVEPEPYISPPTGYHKAAAQAAAPAGSSSPIAASNAIETAPNSHAVPTEATVGAIIGEVRATMEGDTGPSLEAALGYIANASGIIAAVAEGSEGALIEVFGGLQAVYERVGSAQAALVAAEEAFGTYVRER